MSMKVRWMTAFPTRWPRFPSKRLFPEGKNRASLDAEQLSATQDYGVIPQKEFMRRAGRSVVQINKHLDKRKRVEVDDFVISMRSFQGGLERAWSAGGIRSSYVVIKPTDQVHIGYFSRLFKSLDYIQALQATAHFIRDGQDLNYQNFCLVDLPLPPLDEQEKIASFLDFEIEKIDAMIERQEQLIELLGEKQNAVISHIVAKGLNPNAPMRDSGDEWLKEIPAHWNAKRLKYVAVVFASNVDKKSKPGEVPVRLCNYTDVYYNDLITADMALMNATATSSQVERFTLRSGDSIVTKDSEEPSDIAVPTYVPVDLTGVVCGYHLSIIRPMSEMVPHFVSMVFRAAFARAYFATQCNGLTRYGLGGDALGNTVFPIPPREEQAEIVDRLTSVGEKMARLLDSATEQIELLQERRSALISAAVNGKIDLRGWKPPSSGAKQETEMEVV